MRHIILFLIFTNLAFATFREHDKFTAKTVEPQINLMIKVCNNRPNALMEIIFEDERFRVHLRKNENYEIKITTKIEYKEPKEEWKKYSKFVGEKIVDSVTNSTVDFVSVKNADFSKLLKEDSLRKLEDIVDKYGSGLNVDNTVTRYKKDVFASEQTISTECVTEPDCKLFLHSFFKLFPEDTKLWEDGPW